MPFHDDNRTTKRILTELLEKSAKKVDELDTILSIVRGENSREARNNARLMEIIIEDRKVLDHAMAKLQELCNDLSSWWDKINDEAGLTGDDRIEFGVHREELEDVIAALHLHATHRREP